MIIRFRTRELARSFNNKRVAKGLPSKVVDNGKESAKRYAVNLRPEA